MSRMADQNETSNLRDAAPVQDAMTDEMERMSGEGGVAPLMPHRQPTEAQKRAAKKEKSLRM